MAFTSSKLTRTLMLAGAPSFLAVGSAFAGELDGKAPFENWVATGLKK